MFRFLCFSFEVDPSHLRTQAFLGFADYFFRLLLEVACHFLLLDLLSLHSDPIENDVFSVNMVFLRDLVDEAV